MTWVSRALQSPIKRGRVTRTSLVRMLAPFAILVACEIGVLLFSGGNTYYTSIGLQWAAFALLAQGFNIIAGYGGRLAFGNTIFFGLAGYLVAGGAANDWYPQLAGVVIAVVVCCVLAYVLSIALWRVNGLLFALATFAISAMLEQLATVSAVFGGSSGIQEPLTVNNSLINLTLNNQFGYLIVGACLVFLACIFTWWFARSSVGREAQATREDRVAAGTSGINTRQVSAVVWLISAAMTAVAGAFYAQYNLFVDPSSAFGLSTITLIVVPAILGGLGTVWGPVVGSLIIPVGLLLTRLSGNSSVAELNLLVYGGVLIVVLRVYPGGLAAAFTSLQQRLLPRMVDAPGSPRGLAGTHVATVQVAERPSEAPNAPQIVGERADLLDVRDVRKSFGGVHALQGVSFSVGVGEVVGLLGPNGAGKSTIFNCIAGVESPDSGTIRFGDEDISRRSAHERSRAGISRTYQNVRLFPKLTALENVAVGTLRSSGRIAADARAAAALESVGLAASATELAGALSLVDQRHLELARAMVTDARLVMLDEVMTGLNESEAEGVRTMVRELNQRHGTAFVIVEHVMGHILPLISRVIIMNQGQVLADGSPSEILGRRDVIEAYFGRAATGSE